MDAGRAGGRKGGRMELRKVQDASVEGKRVLVRVDYNVPLAEGSIADDSRLRASIPMLEHLIKRDAIIVLMSHLGRPEGQVVEDLRLSPVAERLGVLLGRDVTFIEDCVGPIVSAAIECGVPGDVFLLENTRFRREEVLNESGLARQLGELGEVFVNDAFATLHRSHASTLGVADHLPSYAGLLVQKELAALLPLLGDPKRPYVAAVGGRKAKSKLGPLRDLVSRVDIVLLGGGVAFTFLAALGADIGDSIVDPDVFDEIREVQEIAAERGTEILLPVDCVAAQEVAARAATQVVDARSIPEGWIGLDIGPKTVELFQDRIATAGSIVWTGPMGAFEIEPFADGTRALGGAIAASDAYSVIGGGETGEAAVRFGVDAGVSFISTGGGACLALLRGKPLPALDVLFAA